MPSLLENEKAASVSGSSYKSLDPRSLETGSKCGVERQSEIRASRHLERAGIVTKKCCNREFLKAVLLGQILSLLVSGSGLFCGLLQRRGFNFPLAQLFPVYAVLGILVTPHLACRRGERNLVTILCTDGWKYAILGLLDFEATFMTIMSFAYTSVTSVQILNTLSLPTVLVFSRLLLKTKYKATHYIGVIVGLFGMAGLIAADVLTGKNDDNGGSNPVVGDILAASGWILSGIVNVVQEYVVKNYDTSEYLGMIGLFNTFYSGIQLIVLERNDLANFKMSYKMVFPWAGFILVGVLTYIFMAYVIQKTSATVNNISLFSSGFYALLFGIIVFNYSFNLLYICSNVVVLLAIAIYSYQPTQKSTDPDGSHRATSTSKELPQSSQATQKSTDPDGNDRSMSKEPSQSSQVPHKSTDLDRSHRATFSV